MNEIPNSIRLDSGPENVIKISSFGFILLDIDADPNKIPMSIPYTS